MPAFRHSFRVYPASEQIIPTNHALVRLDRMAIEEHARINGKISLALALWRRDRGVAGSDGFLRRMRDFYAPQPASMLDTSAPDPEDWIMTDFLRHPFVMDGEDCTNIPIRAIRSAPAQIVARQTYGIVVRHREPALFMVTMPRRVYERALFPFHARDGSVHRVVALIRPVLARATLAQVATMR